MHTTSSAQQERRGGGCTRSATTERTVRGPERIRSSTAIRAAESLHHTMAWGRAGGEGRGVVVVVGHETAARTSAVEQENHACARDMLWTSTPPQKPGGDRQPLYTNATRPWCGPPPPRRGHHRAERTIANDKNPAIVAARSGVTLPIIRGMPEKEGEGGP
jgi:hypothetical protein